MADPLTDTLALTEAHCHASRGFVAIGEWALRYPASQRLKFSAVVEGSCWVDFDDDLATGRLELEAGDVVLFDGRHGFVKGNSDAVPIGDAITAFGDPGGLGGLGGLGGSVARFGSGAETGVGVRVVGVGGHVSLNRTGEELLMRALPPVIHLRAADERAPTFRWLLDRLLRETSTAGPGASLAADDLAHLLFLESLRACLAEAESLPVGWLRAIADERIAPALHLLHDQPGRAWQLDELAQAAAMSRTTFAERFRTVAGVPPLTYLTNWRMRLAERALRDEDTPLSALAHSLGYTSDSAFSNAFKRINGVAPRRYRETARATRSPSPATAADREAVATA
ncbi:AraC family transcriptional regulator [Kribbella sp. NPDC048928]|uniref:AraC family transcriptional regulator n=1 Tax=Kribbella sp. NPDC048928 TaxID=3364111 RepID=UPI00371C3C99